jgi:hypothetical protein
MIGYSFFFISVSKILTQKLFSEKLGHKIPINQKGQTLVEFVLLLVVVASLSFTFIKVANQGISEAWIGLIKLVVDDPVVAQTITFP